MLSGVNGASPWAADASESAGYLVEVSLGRYSSGLLTEWGLLMGSMKLGLLLWCRITPMSGLMVALFLIRSPVFLLSVLCSSLIRLRIAGVVVGGVMLIMFVTRGGLPSCGGFCSVPGPLQSVQRAEMWGVILALQSSGAVHLGIDNLGVVRHVGRLLYGHPGSVPFELVKEGDLLLLIERMLRLRGVDTVRVTKVKGHADEGVVLDGRVREIDRLGNNAADEAADLGRRRVGNGDIDARRNLSGVYGRWYPVILDLHRFFIAISRAVVNHDGRDGTAPDPLVWSAGAPPKSRTLVHAVRDWAFFARTT